MKALPLIAFQAERDFIEESIPPKKQGEKLPLPPWKEMLTSKAVWAISVAHTLNNYGLYTILSMIPTYLNNIQHYSLSSVSSFISLDGIDSIETDFISEWCFVRFAPHSQDHGFCPGRDCVGYTHRKGDIVDAESKVGLAIYPISY